MSTRLTIGTLFLLILSLIMTGCLSGKSGGSGGGGSNGGGSGALTSITVTPTATKVAPGDSKQFKAMGHFDNGSNRDITSTVTWSSSKTAVATIDPAGLALAVDSGSTNITATSNGISGATSFNVANLSNISIVPLNKKINPTQTQQFQCFANYDNQENRDVTSQAAWTSSDTNVATIDAAGLATAVAAGQTTITATFKGDQATTTLTVNQLVSITLSPIGPAIQVPGTQQFKALGKFDDNSVLDVTNLATWSSDTVTTATVNDSDHKGLATSVAIGQTEISATYLTKTGSTAMDVTGLTFTNADLSGDYVISLTGVDSRGAYFLVGTITADGVGGLTGNLDTNSIGGVNKNQQIHGKYTIFPDGRGDLQLFGSTAGTTSGHNLRIVLTANKTVAQAIEFQTTNISAAKVEKQSQACSAFAGTDFQGTYAFGEGGFMPGGVANVLAAVGTLNANGGVISGQEDKSNGTLSQLTLNGTFNQDPTTKCRYESTVSDGSITEHFVYYLVSPGPTGGKAYFMTTDSGTSVPVLGGFAEQQTATAIADGNYAFLTDHSGTEGEFHIGGQIALSAGNVTGGEQDEAPLQSPFTPATITGGSYTDTGSGRFTLSETTSSGSNPNFVIYTVSGTRFFMLRTDTGESNVALGPADAQGTTTFTPGNYGLHASYLNSTTTGRADGGLLYIPQGSCAICGIGDRDDHTVDPAVVSSLTLAGNTAPSTDASGRGTFSLLEPGNVTTTYIFYVVSGNKLIIIGESPNTDGTMTVQ